MPGGEDFVGAIGVPGLLEPDPGADSEGAWEDGVAGVFGWEPAAPPFGDAPPSGGAAAGVGPGFLASV